jgi:hypothetical protein
VKPVNKIDLNKCTFIGGVYRKNDGTNMKPICCCICGRWDKNWGCSAGDYGIAQGHLLILGDIGYVIPGVGGSMFPELDKYHQRCKEVFEASPPVD